jgi:hypothetical protein
VRPSQTRALGRGGVAGHPRGPARRRRLRGELTIIFQTATCGAAGASAGADSASARRVPRACSQACGATVPRHAHSLPDADAQVRAGHLYHDGRALGHGAQSVQCGQSVADHVWIAWVGEPAGAHVLAFLVVLGTGELTDGCTHTVFFRIKSGSSKLVVLASSRTSAVAPSSQLRTCREFIWK